MKIHPDNHRPRLLAAGVVALLMQGCTGQVTEVKEIVCDPPTAIAGEDQSVSLGALVVLDGSGSLDCNEVLPDTLTWTFDSLPVDSELDNSRITAGEDPAKFSFQPDVAGTYVLRLVATDETDQVSAPDVVLVTVTNSNSKPVADCGGNLTANEDVRLDMDGSASFDPEAQVLSYNWTLSSMPGCSALNANSIYNGQTPNPSLVPDCGGVFVVGLVVSDGVQWSDPAFCSVTVAGQNQGPVADAGVSRALSPCSPQTAELNGFGSYDPEGVTLTFRWSVLEVPAGSNITDASLSDTSAANPSFTWDVPGDYAFQLQVSDGTSWSAPDVVTLTFQEEQDNHPPQANAGDDASITTETDCSTAAYVFTCEDCPSEEVDLDGSASTDARDGDELSFLWSEPTGTAVIASPSSPITTVSVPGFPSVYNTATVKTWDLLLTVEDCADEDTDRMTITYTCTGTYN